MEKERFNLSDKNEIHQLFVRLQQSKIDVVQKNISEIQDSISNETKSSAGDKHETSLAHLQIDMAQQQHQLEQLTIQWRILNQISSLHSHQKIELGSLFNLNELWYYLSASLGNVTFNAVKIQSISQQSPLGSILLGHKSDSEVIFNGKPQQILYII